MRLRDPPASRGTTERSAYGTVTDPAGAGYVVRSKNGRRNRCQTRAHPAPLRRSKVLDTALPLISAHDVTVVEPGDVIGVPSRSVQVLCRN